MKTSPTPNSKPLSPRENTRTVRRIAVFALLFIPLFLNVILISYWTFGQPVGPTGDEPHYLIMSKALLGFDLNLKRVYEDEEIVKQASGGSHIAPHVVVGQAGQWYSMHSPGVPFLVAIPFAVGGVMGARIAMACVAGLLPLLFFRILRKSISSELIAAISSVVLSIGLPFMAASSQIYPEISVGIILLYVADRLVDCMTSRTMTLSCAWWICFWTACLPWLHIKNIAPVVVIVAGVVVSVFRATNVGLPAGRRKAALFSPLLVPVASVLLLLAYNYSHFNHILGPIVGSQSFRPQDWVPVFLGLHLDRAQGLFLQQPLWLLGVAGIPFLLKQAPLPLFFLALSYLSIVAPNSMHLNRYGGFSFAGRFELSAAMLWVFPLARCVKALVERVPGAAKFIAAGGVVYSLALAYVWVPNPGKLYHSASDTLFPTWMRDSLPFFADFTGWYENPVNWLAIGAVAAAVAIGWAWRRQSFGVANKIAIAFVAIAGWCLPGTPNPLYTQKLTAEIESRLIAPAKVPVASQCVPLGGRGSGAVEFQIECITTGATDTVGGYAARPDGLTDAVIQVGVIRGSGRISSIQVELLRMDGIRQGHWDSSSSTTSWMVGVYRQNRPVVPGKVSDLQLAVNAGDEIQLRITVGGGVPGQRFRVTLFMQDGSVATQTAVIP